MSVRWIVLPFSRRCPVRGVCVSVVVLFAVLAAAVAPAAGQAVADRGAVHGELVDPETGRPLPGAQVRLVELGRSELTHGDGSFHFGGLRPGRYTLVAQHIGRALTRHVVEVAAGDTAFVRIEMAPSAIALPGLIVTGVTGARGAEDTYRPTSVLSGADLARRLTASVAATLAHEPGVAVRSFGPAPAQPVIRGMSGDRVLVLEDGRRTGDLAHAGPDHAVGIDPLTAQRIEVVRGAAGLLYGGNALGGVVNVIREEVPRTVPHRWTGMATLQGESVNDGLAGGGALQVGLAERFALRGELSMRRAGDVRTPVGTLGPTRLSGLNASLGASWVQPWGYAGLAVRQYTLDHSVPGVFEGDTIPGAHPGGADLETRRRAARFEVRHLAGLGPFTAVELEGNIVHYEHDEIEGFADQVRIVGSQFDQMMGTLDLRLTHDHDAGSVRTQGTVGASGFWRDLRAAGSFPGLRSAREASAAVYAFEELGFGRFRLQLAGRWEYTDIDPYSRRPIQTGGGAVPVGPRTFGAASASVGALWDVLPGWTLGTTVSRSARTPSIQELFSDGPHLADFSYDIGNPDLGAERGTGIDAFVRVGRPGLQLEASAFTSALRNYIHHAPTGATDPRFRRFPVFEARGDDARLSGADGRVQVELLPRIALDGTLSYVRATRTREGDPLPGIPPVRGGARIKYEGRRVFGHIGWDAAGRQARVPAAIDSPVPGGGRVLPERPTDAYGLFNAGVGVRLEQAGLVHTLALQAQNLTDAVWRDHLSRIKDVAPESGRNLQLLYRIVF
jgi:iron complex outermembrane receptor protein